MPPNLCILLLNKFNLAVGYCQGSYRAYRARVESEKAASLVKIYIYTDSSPGGLRKRSRGVDGFQLNFTLRNFRQAAARQPKRAKTQILPRPDGLLLCIIFPRQPLPRAERGSRKGPAPRTGP
jgi:hypothetical protein